MIWIASGRGATVRICVLGQMAKRHAHDIMITRTGKPIIRKGTGGRSSASGHTATVFGATGFLGRYLVSKLAKQGTVVVCPNRSPEVFRPLKVAGDLGMVVPLEFDARDPMCYEEAVRNSNIVYNLIGRDYETKNFSYDDVHVKIPRQIAQAVAKYDVDRFVHVSSCNAYTNSPSNFLRTKALGEIAVKESFPETTIVRVGPMFGMEDRFMRNLAATRVSFNANHNRETVRPIFVNDVALALEIIMHDDTTTGQRYELCADHDYAVEEVQKIVDHMTLRTPTHINLPKPIFMMAARLLEFLWWPTICRDQVVRQFIDHVPDSTSKTWRDIPGMHPPTQMTGYALNFLRFYRHASMYYDPNTPEGRRERRGEIYGGD